MPSVKGDSFIKRESLGVAQKLPDFLPVSARLRRGLAGFMGP